MENEKKKIRIRVADNVFTVLSAEEEQYTQVLAAAVDSNIKDICRSAHTSVTGAAVLAALNYCDDLNKATREAEELKKRLNAYLEQIASAEKERTALQKENKRLKAELELCRRRLRKENTAARENEPLSAAVKPVRRKLLHSAGAEAAEENQLRFHEEPVQRRKD